MKSRADLGKPGEQQPFPFPQCLNVKGELQQSLFVWHLGSFAELCFLRKRKKRLPLVQRGPERLLPPLSALLNPRFGPAVIDAVQLHAERSVRRALCAPQPFLRNVCATSAALSDC